MQLQTGKPASFFYTTKILLFTVTDIKMHNMIMSDVASSFLHPQSAVVA